MPRQAAFLRGISPMNCKMPELAAAFEGAGFTDVKTVLSSGNVLFTERGTPASLKKKAEAAMEAHLGKSFMTFVRPVSELQDLLAEDPFQHFKLPAKAKRIATFLSDAKAPAPKLPIEMQQAQILAVEDGIVFSAYVPQENDPAFMRLIEKTFGKEVTTRTWDTMRKVVAAA
ncbi:DUF1697 domain-containing protein [Ramlibacter sp. G-1-2-2]|uniref:DUF1697 domain-containing protein n=1 Tax=Ramlibacter agri TaxID=2728837 RepID=A0A848H3V2_9BURK|nr:DUF1697 domain-containing protein [Ramlibacter agri]NML44231.1 DUF1697 domain-containing protein [Ramlibacter agri]